ncbi:MAG: hypothetical protein J2P36_14655 [Ktedonobacteraceae bacterium]|nr:hypothetical protein [Ktedonobacteraceae bacterium]
MSKKLKVLILTSKTGGGHISLAEALRDQLIDDAELEIVDPQSAFVHLHYRLVSRYALWLWAAEFQVLDAPGRALMAHRVFTRLVARSLEAILERTQPDLVITTYPFLTYEVMQVLEKRGSRVPFVMLFTDPNGVHASWLTEKRAALTLAPTRETYAQALSVGFESTRLHLVGWPVRAQFYRSYSAPELLTRIGLSPDPEYLTIFLQGGGEGAARFGHTVERVLALSPRVQVILAAGTNEALYQRFSRVSNVHALPFTREIAPFMAAADVVMGKAGPNMLFESVTLGRPFIATAYIPGQEHANLEFIRRHGLGWVALTAEQQMALLTRLLAERAELASMDASVEEYRRWNLEGTQKIMPLIKKLVARVEI